MLRILESEVVGNDADVIVGGRQAALALAMIRNEMISCGVLPVSRFIRSPKYPGERLALSAKYDTLGTSVSAVFPEYISSNSFSKLATTDELTL